jgi:hypothetical protein
MCKAVPKKIRSKNIKLKEFAVIAIDFARARS